MTFADGFEPVDYLIIGGERVKCGAPCFPWTVTGLEVEIGHGSRRRKPKTVIDLFVWHWTGGENDVDVLFGVLDRRELGVEFAIDHNGNVFQFCDPVKVDTFDAGYVNPRSVGCEIVNYGFRGIDPSTRKRRPAPGELGKLRDTYECRLRGRKRTFARYFASQLNSAHALAEAVSGAIPTIPRCIPLDDDGSILAKTMSRREIRNYSGHLGHFHVSKRKSDPGLDLLQVLAANGYADPSRAACIAPG